MVARASLGHHFDLRRDVSFDFRSLSSGRPRLDPFRRSIRANQFVHTSRRHGSFKDHASRRGYRASASSRCPKLRSCSPHTRPHESRASLRRFGSPQRKKAQSRADGHGDPGYSRELSQYGVKRAPALRIRRRDVLSHWRGHSWARAKQARRHQQTGCRLDDEVSRSGRRQPQPQPQHARATGESRPPARRRHRRAHDGRQRRRAPLLFRRGRNHALQGRLRAISGHHAVAADASATIRTCWRK